MCIRYRIPVSYTIYDIVFDNSVNTIPRSFRGKIPKEQILDPTVGLGAGCSKSTYGCGGPLAAQWRYGRTFPRQICGASCGIAQREGAAFSRNPEHMATRLIGASMIEPGQRELLLGIE
jgi:hypothetical protein